MWPVHTPLRRARFLDVPAEDSEVPVRLLQRAKLLDVPLDTAPAAEEYPVEVQYKVRKRRMGLSLSLAFENGRENAGTSAAADLLAPACDVSAGPLKECARPSWMPAGKLTVGAAAKPSADAMAVDTVAAKEARDLERLSAWWVSQTMTCCAGHSDELDAGVL